ncbi:MAG: hypothetical protein SFU98_11370 [Leptospiraceae bacterium]|nr:hypothetical protein [Leptospiraceae bacterium]
MQFFDKDFILKIMKQFILGGSFALGFFTMGIIAVSIVGTINTFTTGQVIKASDINTNFSSLRTAIENIPDWVKSGANASFPSGGIIVNTNAQANSATVTVNGRISSSVLGTYCGSSSTTTGSMGGYTGAKALCVTACGNANAHMCTAHELSISRQLGITVASDIWYSPFVTSDINNGSINNTECTGFISASGSLYGGVYTGVHGSAGTCDVSRSIACCL